MRTAVLGLLCFVVLWPGSAPAAPPDALLAPSSLRQSLSEAFAPEPSAPLHLAALLQPPHASPGGQVTLRLEGSLAAGFYVYAGPALPQPGPGALRVEWSALPAPAVGTLRKAPPQRIHDPLYEAEADVYRGAFWLEQTLRIPPSLAPGTYPVAGRVAYQVCDGKICSVTRHVPFQALLTVD
ncbi:MAG: hypothetical protein HY342_09090 [Candidatus Lambdaproteobacteria bacterium]|nr:hypothetical protein [Candidatus Lambdaproteobacteria bacterium]